MEYTNYYDEKIVHKENLNGDLAYNKAKIAQALSSIQSEEGVVPEPGYEVTSLKVENDSVVIEQPQGSQTFTLAEGVNVNYKISQNFLAKTNHLKKIILNAFANTASWSGSLVVEIHTLLDPTDKDSLPSDNKLSVITFNNISTVPGEIEISLEGTQVYGPGELEVGKYYSLVLYRSNSNSGSLTFYESTSEHDDLSGKIIYDPATDTWDQTDGKLQSKFIAESVKILPGKGIKNGLNFEIPSKIYVYEQGSLTPIPYEERFISLVSFTEENYICIKSHRKTGKTEPHPITGTSMVATWLDYYEVKVIKKSDLTSELLNEYLLLATVFIDNGNLIILDRRIILPKAFTYSFLKIRDEIALEGASPNELQERQYENISGTSYYDAQFKWPYLNLDYSDRQQNESLRYSNDNNATTFTFMYEPEDGSWLPQNGGSVSVNGIECKYTTGVPSATVGAPYEYTVDTHYTIIFGTAPPAIPVLSYTAKIPYRSLLSADHLLLRGRLHVQEDADFDRNVNIDGTLRVDKNIESGGFTHNLLSELNFMNFEEGDIVNLEKIVDTAQVSVSNGLHTFILPYTPILNNAGTDVGDENDSSIVWPAGSIFDTLVEVGHTQTPTPTQFSVNYLTGEVTLGSPTVTAGMSDPVQYSYPRKAGTLAKKFAQHPVIIGKELKLHSFGVAKVKIKTGSNPLFASTLLGIENGKAIEYHSGTKIGHLLEFVPANTEKIAKVSLMFSPINIKEVLMNLLYETYPGDVTITKVYAGNLIQTAIFSGEITATVGYTYNGSLLTKRVAQWDHYTLTEDITYDTNDNEITRIYTYSII